MTDNDAKVSSVDSPHEVAAIIAPYTARIDTALEHIFTTTPDLPMYGHLAYFMGFANESLKPERTYGGKRFRSSLMAMLGDWYGEAEQAVTFAAALELFHNFTLIHDDVVDKDTHRRGRPTVWHLFGHDHAINDGDAQMIMMASLLAEAAGGVESGKRTQAFMLQQFLVVIEGQYLDFELTKAALTDEIVTEKNYEDMIRRKTAELIVVATEGAAIVSGQSQAEQTHLKEFGHQLGMAYQICDDVVSIWATSETTGKRNYGDLKERKKTLPVLFAHDRLSGNGRERLEELFASSQELSDTECEEVAALLASVGTQEKMEHVIHEHAGKAKEHIQALSLSADKKDTLSALVDSLLPRV